MHRAKGTFRSKLSHEPVVKSLQKWYGGHLKKHRKGRPVIEMTQVNIERIRVTFENNL
jgi:hypothetical protein